MPPVVSSLPRPEDAPPSDLAVARVGLEWWLAAGRTRLRGGGAAAGRGRSVRKAAGRRWGRAEAASTRSVLARQQLATAQQGTDAWWRAGEIEDIKLVGTLYLCDYSTLSATVRYWTEAIAECLHRHGRKCIVTDSYGPADRARNARGNV
uniref:Uncharacterized protein n=1 Tax=Oryza punctata TaxID=4537 RepID=A0A0E0JF89_ORYPU